MSILHRNLVVTFGLGVCLITWGIIDSVYAHDHGKVRMYEINKKGQLSLKRWVKNQEIEGCNSSSRARKVQRFAQKGFAWCQLYSEKDCLTGSEVTAKWGGKAYRLADFDVTQPQTRLLRGTKWNLASNENVTIHSLYCKY